jgi:hypothetical protein
MVLCWLFVPTTEGHGLLDAENELAHLRGLPPGDLDGFNAGFTRRREIARDFWRSREDFRSAELRWLRKTVDLEVFQADQHNADPAVALARLQLVKDTLSATDHYWQLSPQLTQARRRALESLAAALEKEVDALTAKKLFKEAAGRAQTAKAELSQASGDLGVDQQLTERLMACRRRNALAWAGAAEIELRNLEREEKYAEIARRGAELVADLRPEIELLSNGEAAAVLARLNGCRKRALRERMAKAEDALAGLLKEGKYAQVPARARQSAAEFQAENDTLGNPLSLPGAFVPVRQAALKRRVEQACRSLEELLAKKNYVAVASRGAEAVRELGEEGREVGKGDWHEPITAVRRQALAARLDLARDAAREQLKKDQYRAMGQTAEKAQAELTAEADAVGLRAELEKFCDGCRTFAKLARAAKVEEGK